MSFLKFALRWVLVGLVALWLGAALTLVLLRWVDPPTTAVQTQRRMQSWTSSKPYRKQYKFVPLAQISPHLQHAVISAEDARFYQHHGFDWHQIQLAYENDMDGGKIRGASTLTEQLVKNLFFGTERSFVRKGAEVTLVPVAEFVLGKQRILELYLNVVEWGPGVYGADAACHTWYKTSAHNIGKDQAARLAAILPAPRRRKPERMNDYSDLILERMKQVGW
ncbi:Monofunctional biosynthetic peptidoglycan transglycosylase [Candidatus Koribacter versatilis Ellin345]|uniref:Biosynthetic peptidoglycan transglycosylase n=1 Tax=Koribacter versatilis (strain Ellin345) TaxID=204669 RepID=Q1IN80_KORVE|nr:monofunctional biosynthetic peptidoglycan transglycosylase [Candidatus Koribacter versatilis]ABF41670.1 Monofunctional biosynthetic peptidoglycan transglycosylase [Candidatus Koribacter versatilis Ellin345]